LILIEDQDEMIYSRGHVALSTADHKDDTYYDEDIIYEEWFVSTEYRLMIL
jgi:hypothetical protein